MKTSKIPQSVRALARECEARLQDRFAQIDEVSMACTSRVMDAFQEYRVSEACFAGTTGYGYDDPRARDSRQGLGARFRRGESACAHQFCERHARHSQRDFCEP